MPRHRLTRSRPLLALARELHRALTPVPPEHRARVDAALYTLAERRDEPVEIWARRLASTVH